ncbi:alpha-1,6-mannosyl-glycoprotein 4-beta-N-acetylglucosaminyltransferase-like isoform X2 [Macrobrachium nipponense]|uniref:alpha-1,6-mannosyl-glycoprotein 4-beta-N-acetylglucosaminyltransferase-like isoform X2 n=1 Tax=Macrobrachium nipponense TaxID=159736 RepID=UPI0030C899A3
MLGMKTRTIRLSFVLVLVIPAVFILCYVSLFASNETHNYKESFQHLNNRPLILNNSGPGTFSSSPQGRGTYDLAGIPFPISIPNNTVLIGKEVRGDQSKRFLTIGISSVWREENYLAVTIDSLLKETSLEERRDIFVFILLADADPRVRMLRASDLNQRYRKEVESGLLRVLQPPIELYVNLDSIARRTYNDSVDRVKWRVKQVLDFAFLFWYTWIVNPSSYYLVLEDDVLSATHFVSSIKDFVQVHENHKWMSLELSGFIIIGQLLRCQDLNSLATFLLLFHREHPVDFLFKYWVSLMAPERPPDGLPSRRIPGLFQHIGIHSTLANKTQPIKDNTFGLDSRRISHTNPEARVVTTMKQYQSFGPEQAYSSPGMFWGISKPGDTFDVIFMKPLNVSRVLVLTGATLGSKIRDRLDYGILEVSPRFLQMQSPRRASCEGFTTIQMFKKGSVDVRHLRFLFPEGIQCVRINIGTKQKSWIIVREISVFTDAAN